MKIIEVSETKGIYAPPYRIDIYNDGDCKSFRFTESEITSMVNQINVLKAIKDDHINTRQFRINLSTDVKVYDKVILKSPTADIDYCEFEYQHNKELSDRYTDKFRLIKK